MRLCHPVASHVGHFCQASDDKVLVNFPGQGLPARVRAQGRLIALVENENAAQRVQTAAGCSRCGRDCKREPKGKRWRDCACSRCGAAVFCFNASRKKFACMLNLNEFGRKKGRSRSIALNPNGPTIDYQQRATILRLLRSYRCHHRHSRQYQLPREFWLQFLVPFPDFL